MRKLLYMIVIIIMKLMIMCADYIILFFWNSRRMTAQSRPDNERLGIVGVGTFPAWCYGGEGTIGRLLQMAKSAAFANPRAYSYYSVHPPKSTTHLSLPLPRFENSKTSTPATHLTQPISG